MEPDQRDEVDDVHSSNATSYSTPSNLVPQSVRSHFLRRTNKRRLSIPQPPHLVQPQVASSSASASICSTKDGGDVQNLRHLVDSLDPSQLHFVNTLVMARLQHDPLRSLPSSLMARIVCHLDLPTVAVVSRISRAWALVIMPTLRPSSSSSRHGSWLTEVIWRRLFYRQHPSLTTQSQMPPRPSARAFYAAIRTEYLLRKNWTKNLARSVSLECHAAYVITCLHIDSEAGRIITASDDSTVCVWDALSGGAQQETLRGHDGGVWALAIAHNLLVIGSTDRSLSVWDLRTGRRRVELLGHTSTVRCVEIQEELVVSGSRDTTLRVWNWASGTCTQVLRGHTGSVRCMAPVGPGRFASGSYDNTVRIWDIRRGRCIRVLTGHENKVYSIAVYIPPSGASSASAGLSSASATRDDGYDVDPAIHAETLIYSGSMDATIRVWSARSGSCLQIISGFKSLVGLMEIKRVMDRSVLVAGSTDGSIQVWDAARLQPLAHAPSAHHNSITCLAFNGSALVTGSEGIVRMWDLHALLRHPPQDADKPAEPAEPDDDGTPCGAARPVPALKNIGNLIEQVDMVWRVAVSDRFAVIAYQSHGSTRMRIMDFLPSSA